jgi:hypothetical protein
MSDSQLIDTTKGQLSLEHHGGRTLAGVWTRICQRILALAAGVWHKPADRQSQPQLHCL